ncbi:MAG: TetR/AcrR family transcriptional regulator [Anaerolineaceae bacterium]|jgi:AcrR family transcriptional regulator|nr:TetR/AcrR family transcriptional regulator [Anaerolineaceae bacterium]
MQQRSRETRRSIMAAAVQLFSTRGYNASSVAEICHTAEVSKGAFYHHFPGKQDLFVAVLEEWLAGLDGEMERLRSVSGSVTESLLAMAGMMEDIFTQAAGQLPMFLEFWVQAARHPEIEALVLAPYRRYRQLFAGMIQQGIDQGEFAEVDADMAAGMLVSIAVGYIMQGLGDPTGMDWSKQVQQGLARMIRSMQRRSE